MNIDGRAYEVTKDAERAEACRRALQVPALVEAIENRTPVILTCPWLHRITTVELSTQDDHPDYIDIRAIANLGRKSGPAAREDTPFTGTRHVCDEPGCPTLVDRVGRCERHGGRDAIFIHPTKTRFTCRRHKPEWSDAVPTARLIKIITTALAVGHTSVPVAGRVATGPRRAVR